MSDPLVTAEAPSNIALIKYMGKIEGRGNLPTNSSLSWTLNGLRTRVEFRASEADQWRPLESANWQKVELSEKGQRRFLDFFAKLKTLFGIQGNFEIRSANNFPSDCGLASSASSFAALTRATYELSQKQGGPTRDLKELADISRQGSGSSCRSFFSPWSVWGPEGAHALELPILKLLHQVVIVDDRKKIVSSSEAHKRVSGSDLFPGRPERAEKRLQDLLTAFQAQDWRQAYELCWTEFWDMHALFETSHPSFGYMTSGSMEVLSSVRQWWQDKGDGPLVTMDAGANVHLLYRPDQTAVRDQLTGQLLLYRSFSADMEAP